MTNKVFTTGDIPFKPYHFPDFPPSNIVLNSKKEILDRHCGRIASTGIAGSDLAIDYIYGKYIKNLSIHTIRASGRVILSFLRSLDDNGSNLYHLSHQNIVKFVEQEQDRGLSIVSVSHELKMVYAFIAFLTDKEILPHTLTRQKIQLKLPKVLPRAIPGEDIKLLLTVLDKLLDRALILLLLRTGMRIGELLATKLSDIVLSERKILIYVGEKNFQGRAVYYSKDAEKALQQWLPHRRGNSDDLFPGKPGRSLSYASARRVLVKALEKAGLEGKGYTLHSLRHTFATDMLNAGLRIEVLQQLLGHYEIAMTMRYAQLVDRTREQEYFKAMDRIEQGGHHESRNINTRLQKVFEKKKLLRTNRKKLPK